jgi:hypothetical protein
LCTWSFDGVLLSPQAASDRTIKVATKARRMYVSGEIADQTVARWP